MIYLISDTHFGHASIIKYCDRPFDNVEQMNEELVKRWNDTVKDDDTVYFLGDICFKLKPSYWWNRLNGQKTLIVGNHDTNVSDIKTRVYGVIYLKYLDTTFALVHDPIDFVHHNFETWLIHGHVHNNYLDDYPLVNYAYRTINVSVELIDYRPISIEKIYNMTKKGRKIQ